MKLPRILALALLSSSVPCFAAAQTNSPSCNNKLIKGSYAFTIEGQVGGSPEAGVAITTFDGTTNDNDGRGNITTIVTAVVNGAVSSEFAGPPGVGTYKVNSDCTGTFTQNFPNRSITVNFVVAQNGNEIYTVVISPPGFTVRTLGKRQFVLPEKDFQHGERGDEG
jgi:hypothetical protein